MSRKYLFITFIFVAELSYNLGAQTETGCLGVSANAGLIRDAARMTNSNESCHRLLVEEDLWKRRMGVEAEIYLCRAMNAFAEPSGNVYLGQPLINRIIQQKGIEFGFQAGGFIMAHEYSHEFQFRVLGDRREHAQNGPNLELQADLLGGYWVGMRLKEQEEGLRDSGLYGEIQAISEIAKRMAFDLGDFAFKSPQHHGTPDQRFHAVSVGLRAGFNSQFGPPDEAFLENASDLYDWSAQQVSEIRSQHTQTAPPQSRPQSTEGSFPQYCCTPAGKLGPYQNHTVSEGGPCFGTLNGVRYQGTACH